MIGFELSLSGKPSGEPMASRACGVSLRMQPLRVFATPPSRALRIFKHVATVLDTCNCFQRGQGFMTQWQIEVQKVKFMGKIR